MMTVVDFWRARLTEKGREVTTVVWVPALRHPPAPTQEEIAAGTDLTSPEQRRTRRALEADRQLLRQYDQAVAFYRANRAAPAGEVTGLEYAIRCRASVHDDHPDYREEWRP